MPNFAINITGATGADAKAAQYIVDNENARRAALDPPGTPLPTSPANALLASYETVLAATLSTAHDSYIVQAADADLSEQNARERWRLSSDAQRAAALAELEPLAI